MDLIRVSDFARKVGCSPQNIYKHVRNYAAELEGHLHGSRRGLLLDEYAQEFIRGVMYPKEVSGDTALREELEQLRSALFAASQENSRLAVALAQTEGERDKALLEAGQLQKLLTASQEAEEARKAEVEELREENRRKDVRHAAVMNRGIWARLTNKEVEV